MASGTSVIITMKSQCFRDGKPLEFRIAGPVEFRHIWWRRWRWVIKQILEQPHSAFDRMPIETIGVAGKYTGLS